MPFLPFSFSGSFFLFPFSTKKPSSLFCDKFSTSRTHGCDPGHLGALPASIPNPSQASTVHAKSCKDGPSSFLYDSRVFCTALRCGLVFPFGFCLPSSQSQGQLALLAAWGGG